jgi:dephospho-CoA kinase
MSRRVLICVTGMPGSGKSVVSAALSKLAKKVVSMGDAVREEARRRGLPPDLKAMMELAQRLREEHGPAAVAKLVLRMIDDDGVFVIDGVRSLHEISVFREFGDVLIVAVHASPRTRFSRLTTRGRKDDPRSWKEFTERDMKELKFGIGNVIALADIMIVNEDKTPEKVAKEALEAVRRVLSSVSGESGSGG